QPGDGLGPSGRGSDHRRRACHPRGALDPGARAELYLPRLPLPCAAARAQPHHRAPDPGCSARGRGRGGKTEAGGDRVLTFPRRLRVDRERVHGAFELAVKRCIYHAVALEPALPFEGSRYNIDTEMRLTARPMAGVAIMQL